MVQWAARRHRLRPQPQPGHGAGGATRHRDHNLGARRVHDRFPGRRNHAAHEAHEPGFGESRGQRERVRVYE